MMMKYRFFPGKFSLLILVMLLVAGCSQKVIYQSHWQPDPLQTDIIPVDWEASAEQDPAGTLDYAIKNDNDNLYVFLKTAHRLTQVKMLRAGVQLDFDTLGREDSHMAIRFPYYPDEEDAAEFLEMPLSGRQGSRPAAVNEALEEQTTMYMAGFAGLESGPLDHLQTGGARVRMKMDEAENMYYWAVIPLHLFPAERALSAEGSHMAIAISVLGIDMGQDMEEGPLGSGLYRPVPGRREETVVGWPGDRPGGRGGGPARTASLDELQRTQTFRTLFQLAAPE